MALSDEVQTRYSAQRLIDLTNPDAGNQTSINTTKLNAACTDIAGVFRTRGGITFDVTNAEHVAIACEGVVALLAKRIGAKGAADTYREWVDEELVPFARSTGGQRKVVPTTSSDLTPSGDLDTGQTIARPAFDRRRFDGVVLDGPAVGEDPA